MGQTPSMGRQVQRVVPPKPHEYTPPDELHDGRTELTVATDRDHVLAGTISKIHSLVSVVTPDSSDTQNRPPLFVACVLDKSGSMRGSSISFAKKAASKLVKHLESKDVLHFFAYDTHVETIFVDGNLSVEGKQKLEEKIKHIRVGSSTNLFGGLKAAADALRSSLRTRADFATQLNGTHGNSPSGPVAARIMLFSDGLVNSGVTDNTYIAEQVRKWYAEDGITVSTFGIGQHFDESLMTSIAENGRGYYGYLGKPADIPKQVGKALHSLLSVTGTDAILNLSPTVSGVSIARVYGDAVSMFSGTMTEDASAGTVSIPLGDLHNSNNRSILTEIQVDARAANFQADPSIALQLSYVTDKGQKVYVDASINIAVTNDQNISEVQTVCAGRVHAALAIQNATDRETEVMQLVERGRYETAIELQQITIDELTSVLPLAGFEYEGLVSSVLATAKDSRRRLESTENSVEYCLQNRCNQRLQRRLSVECLAECNDSDEERSWSDGWSDEDSAIGQFGNYRTRIRRRSRSRSRSPIELRQRQMSDAYSDSSGSDSECEHDLRLQTDSNFRPHDAPPPYSVAVHS